MNLRRAHPHVIEFILAATVIAVLVFIGAVKVTGADDNNRGAATRATLAQLERSIERYRADTGRFPSQLSDLRLGEGGPTPSLLEHAELTDGWRRPFKYYVFGNRVRIHSAGPDGRFDTADDLTNR